jgi:hypothetical protein
MVIVEKLVEWRLAGAGAEETWPSASLSNTNPTWLDPGLNPGRRVGKPATNRLSYGAACVLLFVCMLLIDTALGYLELAVYMRKRSYLYAHAHACGRWLLAQHRNVLFATAV